jgi:hypothetical protein
MARDTQTVGDAASPEAGGRFLWRGPAVALLAAPLLGAIAAWGAHAAEPYFAPLVIFPLVVGLSLGAMLVGLLRTVQLAHRPTIWTGLLLAAVVAVAGQHYLAYRAAREAALRDAEKYQQAQSAFPEQVQGHLPRLPQDPLDYMQREALRGRPLLGQYSARGWLAWLSWGVDGLLVLAAAVLVVLPAAGQPYCNRCLSWYCTTRSGRLDGLCARRLAEVAGAEEPPPAEQVRSARYRLLSCRSGCGPTGFELVWEDRQHNATLVRGWLDAEARDRVVRTLEEARSPIPDS